MKKKSIVCAFLMFAFLPCVTVATPIPDTGQTKCYDTDGIEIIPCPQTGEALYGQDGNYSINTQSYTKLDENDNELPSSASWPWAMVRDNVTGLIWEVKDSKDDTKDYNNPHDADNTYTWYDSNPATNGGDPGTPGDDTDTEDFINALNTAEFGGYKDWRLPTIKELSFIVHSDITSGPYIDQSYFPNTVASHYRSATTGAHINITHTAWNVYFYKNVNSVFSYPKYINGHVRAVRGGGQLSNNFIDNGDGTVTDTATGLMWQQATSPGPYNWRHVLQYCEGLILNNDGGWTSGIPNASGAKYDDWRLPNRNELISLVDYSTYNFAIDTDYFPGKVEYHYWSSTVDAHRTGNAWEVQFSSGRVSWQDKLAGYYSRAVRGGQCGAFGDSDIDGICDDGDVVV